MSARESFADPARFAFKLSKPFVVNLTAALLIASILGVTAFFAATYKIPQPSKAPSQGTHGASSPEIASTDPAEENAWMIRGALTEACTCRVPCSCNFGEGPSPQSYCYPFYSYDIREGRYRDVSLNGLHFGAADLRSGRTIFIDERADARQREALLVIAARVIERVSTDEAEATAKEIAPRVRYAAVQQEYNERRNRLSVAGIGEFAADYIMGLDKSQPLIVRNNTTWRIREAIKAKTSIYRVRIGRDSVNTKDTNSNQGEYEYTSKMDFGGPARWNCGACANHAAHGGQDSAENEGAQSCH